MNQVTDEEQAAVSEAATFHARDKWAQMLGVDPSRVKVALVFAWQSDEVHEAFRHKKEPSEVEFYLSSTSTPELAAALLRHACEIFGTESEKPNANH